MVLDLFVCPLFPDHISRQSPCLVGEEAVESVDGGVAEVSGDGLDGELCAGEELLDGTEAILVQEVLVAHTGEHVNGTAQLACIDLEATCDLTRSLELMTGHVDGQDGVENAVVDLRHYERF